MHRDAHMDDIWTPSQTVASGNRRRRSSRIRVASTAPSDDAPSANSSHERASTSKGEPPRKRPQRKRTTRAAAVVEDELSTEEGMKPLTLEERINWEGWVDLESEPALFNYILREYGVKGVKIQELFSLDNEMLAILPQPVYGLIFLFKYRATDDHDDEEEQMPVPGDMWFANQTINNACATVAMLNIVMNAPDIDLGHTLTEFKAMTQELEPAYRGKSLGENEFIRNIHNSFARKVDIHNVDLSENDFARWQQTMVKSTKKKKKPATNNRKKKKRKAATEEPPFHFVAYVPINAQVWRFDGLQHQPLNLGKSNGNWISVARQHIEERMTQYEEDGVEFNLLSLCKSPLLSIPNKMAMVIKSIKRVEGQLDYVRLNWREFTQHEASIGQMDSSYGMTKEVMDKARLPGATIESIANAEGNLVELTDLHQKLSQELAQLRGSYIEEVETISNENELAAIRIGPDTPNTHGAQTLPGSGCHDTTMAETKDKPLDSSCIPTVQQNGEPQTEANGTAAKDTSQTPEIDARTNVLSNEADTKQLGELRAGQNVTATAHMKTVLGDEVRNIEAEGGTDTWAAELEEIQTGETVVNISSMNITAEKFQNVQVAEGGARASITSLGSTKDEDENMMNGGDNHKNDAFEGMANEAYVKFRADANILKRYSEFAQG